MPVVLKKHFVMMAHYNRWANRLLYDGAAILTEEEFQRDVGAFFSSLCGTLNHLLVADLIWLHRFTGMGDLPGGLDLILHEDLEELREYREATDDRIIEWVEELDELELGGRFTYVTATDMKTVSQRLAPALAHFFNHQTHHRGHAHMILSILGETPPSLDLVYFQRSAEGRVFA